MRGECAERKRVTLFRPAKEELLWLSIISVVEEYLSLLEAEKEEENGGASSSRKKKEYGKLE